MNCQERCSGGCLYDQCAKDDGLCHGGKCKSNFENHFCDKCVKGKYGADCEHDCSKHCKYNMCKSENGNCLSGCHDGMYGVLCENKCPENCKKCVSDDFCPECNDGYWGTRCQHKCHMACDSQKCYRDGSCLGCLPGHFGLFCNMSCPINCLNDTCNRQGECHDCKPGYFGKNCTNICPRNCKENECTSKGACINCIDGYFGENCNGILTYTTVNNFETEGNNCSVLNCFNETCPLEACTHGCKEGFYGPRCNLLCNDTCLNSTCHRHTGGCIFECVSGENNSCSNSSTGTSNGNWYSVITISLISGSSFVVILAIGVFVVIRITKWRRVRRKNTITEDNGDGYATIMDVAASIQLGSLSIASRDVTSQQSTLSQEEGNRVSITNGQPEAEENMEIYNLPFEHLSANRQNDDYSEIENTYYITCI